MGIDYRGIPVAVRIAVDMNCIKCGGRGVVLESRSDRSVTATNVLGTTRRRRKCAKCGERWTTIEVRADEFDLGNLYELRELKKQLLDTVTAINAKVDRLR